MQQCPFPPQLFLARHTLHALVAIYFLVFLPLWCLKREAESNVLRFSLVLLLFVCFLLLQKVSKGTPNLRKTEAKGKAT